MRTARIVVAANKCMAVCMCFANIAIEFKVFNNMLFKSHCVYKCYELREEMKKNRRYINKSYVKESSFLVHTRK